jgi:hypothetical protein
LVYAATVVAPASITIVQQFENKYALPKQCVLNFELSNLGVVLRNQPAAVQPLCGNSGSTGNLLMILHPYYFSVVVLDTHNIGDFSVPNLYLFIFLEKPLFS